MTTSAQPIRFALAGAGGFAANYLRIFDKMGSEGIASLVAIADPAPERFPEIHGKLTASGGRWYQNFDELLENERELDAIAICTPIPLHDAMVRASLRRGLAIYLEKPPVVRISDWEDIAAMPGVEKIGVGFIPWHSGALETLRAHFPAGSIRRIEMRAIWPRDTAYYQRSSWAGRLIWNGLATFDGPATNALAHQLQRALQLAGPSDTKVALPVSARAELYRARAGIETYDNAWIEATTDTDVELLFALSHSSDKTHDVEFLIHGDGKKAHYFVGENRLLIDGQPEKTFAPEVGFDRAFQQYVSFLRSEAERPITTFLDTKGYTLLTNAALVSSGGIHALPADLVKETPSHACFLEVEESIDDGRLPSIQGRRWAHPPESIGISADTKKLGERFDTLLQAGK